MSLKETLFPNSNITGYTDRNNQPILVGQQIKDDGGNIVKVFSTEHGFVVSDHEEPNAFSISLKLWLLGSDWVEIIVQKPEHNEAPVALAPFRDIKNAAGKVKTKRNY